METECAGVQFSSELEIHEGKERRTGSTSGSVINCSMRENSRDYVYRKNELSVKLDQLFDSSN